jgi:L-iditol 2-dehydrogenase
MGVLHHLLLRVRNARTLLVDISRERLERARNEFGAHLIIDAAQENVVERVKELTDGMGADVVITAAPSAAAVAQSVDLVRKRGRIGLFGGLPAAQAEVALNINKVHYSELRLLGNFSYHPRYHRDALRVLAEGGLDCEKLITTYPLEKTVDGFTDIRASRILKAVVIPNNGAML